MDPIAICGSALNVLNKIKEQLKECEAAFEAAAELNAMLEIFEVTIMMVSKCEGWMGSQLVKWHSAYIANVCVQEEHYEKQCIS